MKEGSWDECVKSNSSYNVTKDIAKSKALIDTARGRIAFFDTIKEDEANMNYIFEGYYSSLLETMHAFVLSRGFKVENHICLGYYIRDVMKNNRLFFMFDDVRKKRNSLIYYGKHMDADIAQEAIITAKAIILELEKSISSDHQNP
ncbi:MAG: hypothetical protein NDI94_06510 [Candidatus Woesearchaeota archaeon]|nr:hypothetical protein [Candidatus Woesearchaeota archaeon]